MLTRIHKELGIPSSYASDTGLSIFEEPEDLVSIGADIFRREQQLVRPAANHWKRMQAHAVRDDIALHMVSAFRSIEYQVSLFKEKLSEGQHFNDILRVNAAPGYSQHHSGRAIDITTDNSDPLCESFERTPAFRWLSEHAGAYHFFLSYPRNNKWGISYEPWHWFYRYAEQGVELSARR